MGCARMALAQDVGPSVLPPPGAQVELPPLFEFPENPLPAETTEVIEGALSDEVQALGPEAELVAPPMVYEWYQTSYWFGPAPWDMGVNFGLNGSEGQNRSQSIASGAYAKRDSALWTLDSKINYNMTSANSIETQNNALLDVRVDRKIDKSAWSLFILNQTLYDEFQPFDLRVSLNSGLGYKWVESECFDLIGRFGAGASREFGGPDDRWAPEAQLGFDYEQMVFAAHKLTASMDYFPEFEHFGRYRILSEVGWEVALSQPQNLSLKLAATDRYDADPHGAKPHIMNYSVLLLWKL